MHYDIETNCRTTVVSQDGYISQVCLVEFQNKAIRGNPIL
jgi:hypothetical protein